MTKTPKTKIMMYAEPDKWRLMKIHAATRGLKSAQELLDNIMTEWLQSNPLNLDGIGAINQNPTGGNE